MDSCRAKQSFFTSFAKIERKRKENGSYHYPSEKGYFLPLPIEWLKLSSSNSSCVEAGSFITRIVPKSLVSFMVITLHNY